MARPLKAFVEKIPAITRMTGEQEADTPVRILHADNLSMLFGDGVLRYISAGQDEIVRMVYFSVRDHEWLTVKQEVSDLEIIENYNSFNVKFRSRCTTDEIDFLAAITIEGETDSSITILMEGEALSAFRKNRIGFCILHPLKECSGNEVIITHSSGLSEPFRFPLGISPFQPFLDIKKMEWKVNGNRFRLIFGGDIFETEDQRNWTDASFKTYSTPLSEPFPVKVNAGDKFYQKVILKADFLKPVLKADPDANIRISISTNDKVSLPPIGIGHSSRGIPLTDNEAETLKAIGFTHYRIDLHLFNSSWKEKAEIAAEDAARIGIPLELALFFDNDADALTDEFLEWVRQFTSAISVILLYDKIERTTPEHLALEITKKIRKKIPHVKICCGTNANFAEVNRKTPAAGNYDFLSFSIHPQEHASDRCTVVENLEALGPTVKSASDLVTGKGVWISPVNIRRRFNANLYNFEQDHRGHTVPPQVDSRLMSLFGAGWFLGCLKFLSESEPKGITFLETVAERGVIQGDYPSRWPDDFIAAAGMIFPVYHILRFLLPDKSYRVMKNYSSSALSISCLVLSDGRNNKLVVVNHSGKRQKVTVNDLSGPFNVKFLDAESYYEAVTDPSWTTGKYSLIDEAALSIDLEPYCLAFIKTENKSI